MSSQQADIEVLRAFPNLRVRRPVVITNAGDGSNRLFIVTQQGVIHVIENDESVSETKKFLDIESRVVYRDSKNEEGFLGLAFHPDYKMTDRGRTPAETLQRAAEIGLEAGLHSILVLVTRFESAAVSIGADGLPTR